MVIRLIILNFPHMHSRSPMKKALNPGSRTVLKSLVALFPKA